MKTEKTDVLIIGGGPAGLCAAIEAARAGASALLADENARMGGQLCKQIHKFFGSEAHFAGTRGFEIARLLTEEARSCGVRMETDTRALGLLDDGTVALCDTQSGAQRTVAAKGCVLAVGARENALAFPGWTLPGVMGAGAAQTMANLYGVLPGKRIVVVGSGNVGLIVSYQLMQAGAEIVCIAEAAPRVGGYGVHAGKVRRAGVPLLLSHTVARARGTEHVESAVLAKVDAAFRPIPGTERELPCDTILLAAGLSPRTELASMFRCGLINERRLGGFMPLHDARMRTSAPHVFVCGDAAGVEEASVAMDEGRLAGLSAARDAGYPAYEARFEALRASLARLRGGEGGEKRRLAKASVIEQAAQGGRA